MDALKVWRGSVGGKYNDNRPKQHISCRLGLRWVFFYFLCVFFLYLMIYIGTMDSLKVRWVQHRQQQRMTTMGPNSCHLGLRWVFLSLFLYFLSTKSIYIYMLLMIYVTRMEGWRRARQVGAQDATHLQPLVCFIFIIFFSRCFFY